MNLQAFAAPVCLVVATLMGTSTAQQLQALEQMSARGVLSGNVTSAVMLNANHDSVADWFVAAANQDTLHLATSAERYSTAILQSGGAPTRVAVKGDFNGDGLEDLFCDSSPWRLYLNRGAQSLVDVSATHLPAKTIAFGLLGAASTSADFDGDGDLDLIVLSTEVYGGSTLFYLENDGTAHFTVGPAFPALASGSRITVNSCSAGDFDGDGNADLLVGGLSLQLFLGDGKGSFRASAGWNLPSLIVHSMAVGDIDGDADLDFVITTGLGLKTMINLGNRFEDQTRFRLLEPSFRKEVSLGDVDGDGDLDLASIDNGQAVIMTNNGGGYFVSRYAEIGQGRSTKVQFGDMDSDGRSDLLVVEGDSQRDDVLTFYHSSASSGMVWINRPTFPFPSPYAPARGAAIDMNGDGYMDILTASNEKVFINDSTGRFENQSAAYVAIPGAVRALAIGKDPSNGNPIALTAYQSGAVYSQRVIPGFVGPTSLIINHGKHVYDILPVDLGGSQRDEIILTTRDSAALYTYQSGRYVEVSATHLPLTPDALYSVAASDIDGDGDMDLIFGVQFASNNKAANFIAINDGTAHFTNRPASAFGSLVGKVLAITPYDFDRDGDEDLIARTTFGARFLANDGTGIYTDTGTSVFPQSSTICTDVQLADLDSDGIDELIVCLVRIPKSRVEVYAFTGGTYVDHSSRFLPDMPASWILPGDWDKDGDIDLMAFGTALPEDPNPIIPMMNLSRQISAPYPARLGSQYDLLVHHAVVLGSNAANVLCCLDFAPATTPLSLGAMGMLRLDPSTMICVSLPAIGATGSSSTLSLPLPTVPVLRGRVLYSQALLVTANINDWRLTGLHFNRIFK